MTDRADPRQRPLARIEAWLTRRRALIVALMLLPVTMAAEFAIIWSDPVLRWRFPLGHDFVAFWTAARLHAEGGLAAVYDLGRMAALQASVAVRPGLLLWHYPPVYLMLVLPLAALPFAGAWALFSAGGMTALALAARRLLPAPGLIGWAALFGAPVIAVTLIQGQNGAWFAAILIGGFLARGHGRGWLAAALFALLMAKPHIAVLVPVALAAAGDWRLIGRTFAAMLALAGITTLILGPEAWQWFLTNTRMLRVPLGDRALLAQMPTAYAALLMVGAPVWAAVAAQGATAALAVAAVWRAWRRTTAGGDLPLAVLLMAALLVPPYAFRYDMVVTLAATLIVARQGVRTGFLPGEKLAVSVLWLGPALFPALALATGLQTGPLLLLLGLHTAFRRLKMGPSSADQDHQPGHPASDRGQRNGG
ncbi:MAG: glycosyltransferase family 87 protein [Paracoccaceae bacterium]